MRFKLTKETVLIVGLGEIGSTLLELLKETNRFAVYGLDSDIAKVLAANQRPDELPKKVDIMHICIPCQDQSKLHHL